MPEQRLAPTQRRMSDPGCRRNRVSADAHHDALYHGRSRPPWRDRPGRHLLPQDKPTASQGHLDLGAFLPLDTVYEQMFRHLARERSVGGEQTLHEIISTGDIAMLQHLNAPTADGNILRLELLREKNAEIARVLPGKAWYILVGTGEQRGLRLLGRNGMEMEIRGTFRTRAAANERAERILQDSKEAAGPDARAVRADKDGLVGGGVAYREGGVVMAQTVEVRHETGRSSQVDSSGNRL